MFYTINVGNILMSGAQALVNPVNCEGVMGKGLAKQFKIHYPNMYQDYRKFCMQRKMYPGVLHYYKDNGKIIVNFPTKDKWQEPSNTKMISMGLVSLDKLINELNLESIAIPALGCGEGKLSWSEVKPLIYKHLDNASRTTDIYIFKAGCHNYKGGINNVTN